MRENLSLTSSFDRSTYVFSSHLSRAHSLMYKLDYKFEKKKVSDQFINDELGEFTDLVVTFSSIFFVERFMSEPVHATRS